MAGERSKSALGYKSSLRYIEASHVVSPAGEPTTLDVRGIDDQRLGSVDGVLIDPIARRVRFVVVKSPARRFLLSAEQPTCVDQSCKSLRVDLRPSEVAQCEEFEPSAISQYSDDDFLGAMFGHRVA